MADSASTSCGLIEHDLVAGVSDRDDQSARDVAVCPACGSERGGVRSAGAGDVIAIDPLTFKQENALNFDATHTSKSFKDAAETIAHLTNGHGADSVILTSTASPWSDGSRS
jgi:Zn-dependent alcohol dehydrogenase